MTITQPAFPVSNEKGLRVIDFFAVELAKGILANSSRMHDPLEDTQFNHKIMDQVAHRAYEYAECMVTEANRHV